MTITICGSIAFYPTMQQVQNELEALGHKVLIPELTLPLPERYGGERALNFDAFVQEHGGFAVFPAEHDLWQHKGAAIQEHFEKIANSDALLIVNERKAEMDGYIGSNTLIEMGVGFFLKKPIYLLHQPSPTLRCLAEVYGMSPIVIHGDLSQPPFRGATALSRL
jgi:hypothetical protein